MSDTTAALPAAKAWPDRVLAALPLAIVFIWLFFLYTWESWGHVTPWLFTDELQNAQLSRAIAATGHAARRGEPYGFQSLYNYVIAPAWWIHSTHTAYSLVKIIGALVMTSTVFPAYFLARMVVAPRYALFAAAASAAIPAFVYTSLLVEEPAAYPWATLCFFLMAKALLTRSRWWVGAAVVASLIAPLVRGELAILPLTFFLAWLFLWWTGERARAWRSGWTRWDWVGAVVLCVGILIVFNATVSAQSHEWLIATGYYRMRMIRYGLWAAGALTIGIGVLPIVAGARRARAPPRRAAFAGRARVRGRVRLGPDRNRLVHGGQVGVHLDGVLDARRGAEPDLRRAADLRGDGDLARAPARALVGARRLGRVRAVPDPQHAVQDGVPLLLGRARAGDPPGGEPSPGLDAAHRADRAALDARDLDRADRAAAVPRRPPPGADRDRRDRSDRRARLDAHRADLRGDRVEQLLERLHRRTSPRRSTGSTRPPAASRRCTSARASSTRTGSGSWSSGTAR